MVFNIEKIMSILCRPTILFGIGVTDPFKPNEKTKNVLKIKFVIFFIGVLIFSLSEIGMLFKLDYRDNEYGMIALHCFGHFTANIQFLLCFIHSNKINKFFKEVFLSLAEVRNTPHVLTAANKKAKFNSICFVSIVIITYTLTFMSEGAKAFKKNDELLLFPMWLPFETYPYSLIVKHLMVLFLWLPFVHVFVSVYLLSIMPLIALEARFIEVSVWLESLDGKNENFTKELNKIIHYHNRVLKCADEYQYCFSWILTIQLVQSILTISSNVVSYLSSDRELHIFLRMLFSMLTLLLMLSLYTFNAGDVTHKSILISDSAEACNWESGSDTAGKHQILTMMIRSQKPVLIKAFGVFHISHEMFVAVLRAVYSIVLLF